MKVWERRLMKDFKVAPVATEEEFEALISQPPPENEDSISKYENQDFFDSSYEKECIFLL